MNKWAWLGIGAGVGLVYLSSRPGGLSAAFDSFGSAIGLTAEQRAAFMSNFAPHISNAGAAATGAQAGAPLAGPTFGLSVVGGALIGYFAARGSNDTREDREVFARRLGFRQLGGEVDGLDQTVTSINGRNSLYGYLNFIGRPDLTDFAMHVIGRKDFTDNDRWFSAVLDQLNAIGFPFPTIAT